MRQSTTPSPSRPRIEMRSFSGGHGGGQNSGGRDCGRELAEVIREQRSRHDQRAANVNGKYWLERHALAPPVWQRSASAAAPRAKILDHMTMSAQYDRDLLRRLATVCRKLGCSRFELYLCVFSWIAFQLCRQDRLAVQVIFDSRAADETNLVGMFSGVHPVVLRRPDGAPEPVGAVVDRDPAHAARHRLGGDAGH